MALDFRDQYFGCEIEMTGITRRQAAEAAAALFGATARQTHESRTYDPWEVMDREGKAWRFVYDASIRGSRRLGLQQVPTGDGVYKVEMNSPKLEYSELGKLQEVVRALRRAGATFEGEGERAPAEMTITKADFFEWGLSGRPDSTARRAAVLKALDLPQHMTANALLEFINAVGTRQQLCEILQSFSSGD